MNNPFPSVQEKKEITQTNEILVEVQGLSKKFCKDLKTSLWYGVKDLIAGYSGNKNERQLRPKEFWAVKDINFTLKRGECLGLIGHNGAGKSTLLKILNGLINPDEGKVVMKGKVGALIELGAGFNPILTGRENIYNNGAVLGFSRQEINEKLDFIISFAELEEFIDMPVQNYSSGMKVRLGFAVASQMEPDVLIIDEVLAVGDLGFVLKCFKTIDTILPKTAIIFVSHSMPMVSRICNQIILMDKGKAKFQGSNVSMAIDLYYQKFSDSEKLVVHDDGKIELSEVRLQSEMIDNSIHQFHWKDDLIINLRFKNKNLQYMPYIEVFIFDKEQRSAGVLYYKHEQIRIIKNDYEIKLTHKCLQFSKGMYSFSIILYEDFQKQPIYRINSVENFQVIHDFESWSPLLLDTQIEVL